MASKFGQIRWLWIDERSGIPELQRGQSVGGFVWGLLRRHHPRIPEAAGLTLALKAPAASFEVSELFSIDSSICFQLFLLVEVFHINVGIGIALVFAWV